MIAARVRLPSVRWLSQLLVIRLGRPAAAVLIAIGMLAAASAQDAAKQAAGTAAKGDKTPARIEIGGSELVTEDGVQLRATYCPRTEGKDVVPVVLLHAYKGSRKDYEPLTSYLHGQGFAVLVPDLRGHGDSTHQVMTYGARRKELELDAGRFRAPDFRAMVDQDMAAIRRFLVRKNNAG